MMNLLSVPIELYEGNVHRVGTLARPAPADRHPVGQLMSEDWKAGVWEEPDPFSDLPSVAHDAPPDMRAIFGLTFGGRPSHMAYRLDEYFDPCEVIVRLDDPGFGRFYFDAGGNGRPIWAERDALAKVFVQLGLISTDWGWHPGDDGADNQADPHKENTNA